MPDEDLIAELRGLASHLDLPEAADQRAMVRQRLSRPVRRRRRVRLWIASVVAAVAATIAAVAPARAAVVDVVNDLLRVAGIETTDREATPLPTRPSPLPSGRTATLDEVRKIALFPVRVPAALGEPESIVLADPDAAGAPRVVTLLYRGGAVRVDEFDGRAEVNFLKTVRGAQYVDLGPGTMGAWLPEPHEVTYVGRDGVTRTETARLATPTLIWIDGTVTYRLEGLTTLGEARQAALSLR